MIIKGRARGSSRQLAEHLLRTDDNERIHVCEIRGTVARDLPNALLEMEAFGAATRSSKPLYHASISPEAHTPLTPEQIAVAADTLGAALGLDDRPRVVLVHAKKGREHVHVVWSRVDIDNGRVVSDAWNYRAHEQAARALEALFGHRPVSPSRSTRRRKLPSSIEEYELRQGERTTRHVLTVTSELSKLWSEACDGGDFVSQLEAAGYQLARGDRRVFVVVDKHGEVHSLARRVVGAKAADVRGRLAAIDLDALASVAEARAAMTMATASLAAFTTAAHEICAENPAQKSAISSHARFSRIESGFAIALANTKLHPDAREQRPVRFFLRRMPGFLAIRADILLAFASKLATAPNHQIGRLLSEREAALEALDREHQKQSPTRTLRKKGPPRRSQQRHRLRRRPQRL